jgi:hypothetical protein
LTPPKPTFTEQLWKGIAKPFVQLKGDDKSNFDEDKIYLKSFKEISQNDLEMLFPNSKISIDPVDKAKLIVFGGGGTVGGITPVATQIVTLDPTVVLSGLFGLGMLIWRQVKNIFYHRNRYMVALTNNLYFHNLDNNRGSIMNLLDLAESEESKETFLGYIFIYKNRTITREKLDLEIENFIFENFSVKIDFDVNNSIQKLKEWNFIKEESGVFSLLSK